MLVSDIESEHSRARARNLRRREKKTAEKEAAPGPFAFLSAWGKELDNFIDDATMKKLGNGDKFYGKRKSNFYGAAAVRERSARPLSRRLPARDDVERPAQAMTTPVSGLTRTTILRTTPVRRLARTLASTARDVLFAATAPGFSLSHSQQSRPLESNIPSSAPEIY